MLFIHTLKWLNTFDLTFMYFLFGLIVCTGFSTGALTVRYIGNSFLVGWCFSTRFDRNWSCSAFQMRKYSKFIKSPIFDVLSFSYDGLNGFSLMNGFGVFIWSECLIGTARLQIPLITIFWGIFLSILPLSHSQSQWNCTEEIADVFRLSDQFLSVFWISQFALNNFIQSNMSDTSSKAYRDWNNYSPNELNASRSQFEFQRHPVNLCIVYWFSPTNPIYYFVHGA